MASPVVCERAEDGGVLFKSLRGNVLAPYPYERPATESESPMQWFDTRLDTSHITASTCVTRWTGERIDWALAVGHLFHRPSSGAPVQ